jgi:hypothetical protein
MKLFSRADAIKSLTIIPAAIGLVGALASVADAADNKKQFKYQDKPGPKGANCVGCSLFRKPSSCTLVTGKISPKGWCIAWSKK